MGDKEEYYPPVLVEYRPCECSISDEPHHHVDSTTIIPWDVFTEGFRVPEVSMSMKAKKDDQSS